MRFRDYLDSLRPSDQERLINLLTLGSGRLALALRLIQRDRSLTEIGELLAAQTALRTAARILVQQPGMASIGSATPPPGTPRPGVHWQAFILRLTEPQRSQVLDELDAGVDAARRAGELALADDELTAVSGQLQRALQALTQLWRVLVEVVRTTLLAGA